MQRPDQDGSRSRGHASAGALRDPAARIAGGLLLLTTLATVAMVVGRVGSGADEPTLAESLTSISRSQGLYTLSGAGRLLSGITLITAARYLSRTRIIKERYASSLTPAFFSVSGVFTAVSGALAIALAVLASDVALLGAGSPTYSLAETTADIRWLTGKIGFAAAGLALLLISRYPWRVRGPLRYVAPSSSVVGAAMQFIWVDSASVAHPVVGAAFLLWLVAVGWMLLTGRAEEQLLFMDTQSGRDAPPGVGVHTGDDGR